MKTGRAKWTDSKGRKWYEIQPDFFQTTDGNPDEYIKLYDGLWYRWKCSFDRPENAESFTTLAKAKVEKYVSHSQWW